MEPGAYVFCRTIEAGIIGSLLRPRHQFVVLIPQKKDTLSGIASDVAGQRCLVLGAYNIDGFLRAEKGAPSDSNWFAQSARGEGNGQVQFDSVKIQACLLNGIDQFIDTAFKCFQTYRSYSGKRSEIRYPVSLLNQVESSWYNSNSWAQSLIWWTSSLIAPSLVVRDFEGSDVGHDRIIPKAYFIPSNP
jgi:hypothetical protein